MSCSSATSESLAVLDYPCGKVETVNLDLKQGFKSSMALYVVAVTNDKTHFNILDKDNNALLHISVRTDKNEVVFNTRRAEFELEEIPSKMPVKKDEKYNLLIAYETEGYRIYINGEEFYFFKHRFHTAAKTFALYFGKIYSVAYKLNNPKWAIHRPINEIKELSCEKETPHEIELQGCKPLNWIQIFGTVKSDAGRFDVNLMNSCREVLFHFNPRFEDYCVVRNTSSEGKWGTEERHGGIPFLKNEKFVLTIVVENDLYRTYVNGEEFITYNHRAPANAVAKLQITNDIRIHKIIYHK